MGNFYTNYTLRGPSQQAVAAALAGRKATVTPPHSGCVVAFDEASDDQDQERIVELAARLSSELRCPVLAVLNHDDDILWYQLYESGKQTDEYDSSPGYFDPSAEPSAPAGGDAQRLKLHVAVAAEALRQACCTGWLRRIGAVRANQPEYDLLVSRDDHFLKVSVQGSQDGGWRLCQSYKRGTDYAGAIQL